MSLQTGCMKVQQQLLLHVLCTERSSGVLFGLKFASYKFLSFRRSVELCLKELNNADKPAEAAGRQCTGCVRIIAELCGVRRPAHGPAAQRPRGGALPEEGQEP